MHLRNSLFSSSVVGSRNSIVVFSWSALCSTDNTKCRIVFPRNSTRTLLPSPPPRKTMNSCFWITAFSSCSFCCSQHIQMDQLTPLLPLPLCTWFKSLLSHELPGRHCLQSNPICCWTILSVPSWAFWRKTGYKAHLLWQCSSFIYWKYVWLL